jgi:hypothetical protein
MRGNNLRIIKLLRKLKIRGKTSYDWGTVKDSIKPILGLDFILEDFVEMNQALLLSLAKGSDQVCSNFQKRVESIIQLQAVFNQKPILYIGRDTA